MFPMISSVDEFCQARGVVLECLEMLAKEGLEHHDSPKMGMMVELPAISFSRLMRAGIFEYGIVSSLDTCSCM